MDVEMIQVNPRLGRHRVAKRRYRVYRNLRQHIACIVGGFPIKFVAVSVKKSEHFLIVRPEIKEIRDLSGKKLGVATLFGSDQRAAEEMIRAKGFSPNMVKPITLGEAPVRAQALRSGWSTRFRFPPFDLSLQTEGFRALAGPKDIEIALPTSGMAVANRFCNRIRSM